MSWRLSGNCVVHENGETIKCHATHGQALAHMRALYANAGKPLGDDEIAKLELVSEEMIEFTRFVPMTKVRVDEEKREVWGYAAIEEPDGDGEILDYFASKPHFIAWSERMRKASGGLSVGNLRVMHTNVAAGKLIHFEPRDGEKGFYIGAKVVDDGEWAKCREGVYTGFSIGGHYVRRWRDAANPRLTRYEGRPIEVSLADMPSQPGATFEIVKASGVVEKRAFMHAKAGGDAVEKAVKVDTKKVVEMLQAARNESEITGNADGAQMITQAIALVLRATGEGEQAEHESMAREQAQDEASTKEGEQGMYRVSPVGRLRKTGRTFSTGNSEAMHGVIRALSGMLASAGDPIAQRISSLYAEPDSPESEEVGKTAAATLKKMTEVERAMSDVGDLLKAMDARIDGIGQQPALGGPVLRPVEKSLAGGEPSDSTRRSFNDSLAELRKSIAIEADPVVKAGYQARLRDLESRTH